MCVASPNTRSIAVATVEKKFKSAVFAGDVPDPRHLSRGGYHVCLVHLWSHGNADDYSNRRRLDESTAFTAAGRALVAAFDISLSPADMKRVYANVRKVWLDESDPRRKWINAINCWDGSGDATRFDFVAQTAGYASPDHKTHIHCDQPRAYVDLHRSEPDAQKAARAAASVITGEARAVWEGREEGKPAPKPKATTYTVVAGDNLTRIGARSGVTVANLQAWNGLKSTVIFPGQVLRLTAPPRPVPAVAAWPVGPGDYFRPRAGAPAYVTVGRWQAQMRVHGWTITVDERLGPKSGAVLLAFQRAEGLKVTGVLDKATFTRAWTTSRRGR